MTSTPSSRPSLVGPIVAALLGIAAMSVCFMLGSWQWSRAQVQGTLGIDDPVSLQSVARPAESSSTALGKWVSAEGAWGEGLHMVSGRQIDGQDAVMVLREFLVPDEEFGEAHVAVVLGWVAPDELAPLDLPQGDSAVVGYLRGSEGRVPSDSSLVQYPGATAGHSLSTAELAQEWPSPLYAPLLVLADAPEGLQALPLPPAEKSWNFQSLTYALEWWIFGLFAGYLAFRWIRDNRRNVKEKVDVSGE